MKRTLLLSLVAAGLLAAGTGAAFAQDAPPPVKKHSHVHHARKQARHMHHAIKKAPPPPA